MEKSIKTKNFIWRHYTGISDAETNEIETRHAFHHLDIEDVQSGPQQPKIDFYKDYLFGIFHFPDYASAEARIHVMELNVFLGKDYLITITKGNDKRMEELHNSLRDDEALKKEFMSQGAAFLLYSILDQLTERCWPVVRRMSTQINDVEETIYTEEKRKHSVWQIALIRRNLIRLKRILNPQTIAVKTLARTDKPYFSKELSIYFDDISDTLNRMQAITEGHVEVVNTLHNVNESLISQRTNDVIKVLTVISVSLLPMTLLTGIYGMNVDNLPFVRHPNLVWLIFGTLFFVIVVILTYFHRKDLL